MVPNFLLSAAPGSSVRTVTSNGRPPGPCHRSTGAASTVASAPGSSVVSRATRVEATLACSGAAQAEASHISAAAIVGMLRCRIMIRLRVCPTPGARTRSRPRSQPDGTAGNWPAPDGVSGSRRPPRERHDRRDSSRASGAHAVLVADRGRVCCRPVAARRAVSSRRCLSSASPPAHGTDGIARWARRSEARSPSAFRPLRDTGDTHPSRGEV